MFRNDRAIPTLNRCVNVPSKRIFLFFLSLSLLELANCCSREPRAIFEYTYMHTFPFLGQNRFSLTRKNIQRTYTAKRHEQFLFVATPIFPSFPFCAEGKEGKDSRGNCILSRSEIRVGLRSENREITDGILDSVSLG